MRLFNGLLLGYLFVATQFQGIAQTPAPIFAGNDTTICEGTFITLTADNPWGVPVSWNNGVTDGVPFSPFSTGEYIVTANNSGTYSYDTVTVTVESVMLNFSSDNTAGCPPLAITLTDWSNAVNCMWTVDNGSSVLTSTNCVDAFVLSEPGLYDVTLQAQNQGGIGCTGSVTYYDYIYVEVLPQADFTVETFGCDPTQVTFQNNSQNASSYVWNITNSDIGYSSTTTMWGPFTMDLYEQGLYDVELICSTNFGCTDTLFIQDAFEVGCNELSELVGSNKTLVKLIDFTGRETEFRPNTVLIYIYSDGTTEKVFRFE